MKSEIKVLAKLAKGPLFDHELTDDGMLARMEEDGLVNGFDSLPWQGMLYKISDKGRAVLLACSHGSWIRRAWDWISS